MDAQNVFECGRTCASVASKGEMIALVIMLLAVSLAIICDPNNPPAAAIHLFTHSRLKQWSAIIVSRKTQVIKQCQLWVRGRKTA